MSQFTLYGVLKGNKPDFHVAMPPDAAKPFYASLVEKFQKAYRIDAIKGDRNFLVFCVLWSALVIKMIGPHTKHYIIFWVQMVYLEQWWKWDFITLYFHGLQFTLIAREDPEHCFYDPLFFLILKVNLVNDGPVTMQLDSNVQSSKWVFLHLIRISICSMLCQKHHILLRCLIQCITTSVVSGIKMVW